jgi:tetratricopeptide (TPR) repeat protein
VEILLDTESHSYYQIAVNPAGALIDLDRGATRANWFRWASQAEVATQVSNDHWTIEIRIPVTEDENDPLHRVIGRKPTQSLPWHINICRQRIRDNGEEYSAFAPTGTDGFHEPMKFAHFYDGRSHRFPADPTVKDYLIAGRKAYRQWLHRHYEEALAAYLAMAERHATTDFQRSDALAYAARCACGLRDYTRAGQLADRIPIESVAKTVRMENLLAQRQWTALVEQFGDEDLRRWPFWQVGAGAFARGKAHMFSKQGEKADADLQTALKYTVDPRVRINILAEMGSNREVNLKDDAGALEAFRKNLEGKERIGGADEFRSLQRAAAILARQGEFEEAITLHELAAIEKLGGYWRHAMLLSLGNTLAAAGRRNEALTAYRELLADDAASKRHREAAENAVERLEGAESGEPARP